MNHITTILIIAWAVGAGMVTPHGAYLEAAGLSIMGAVLILAIRMPRS